jgi:hypothetical protein
MRVCCIPWQAASGPQGLRNAGLLHEWGSTQQDGAVLLRRPPGARLAQQNFPHLALIGACNHWE